MYFFSNRRVNIYLGSWATSFEHCKKHILSFSFSSCYILSGCHYKLNEGENRWCYYVGFSFSAVFPKSIASPYTMT